MAMIAESPRKETEVGEGEIFYPESDGKPMADNMTQHRWMSLIFGNLERRYKDDPNVLVCTDLLWYPLQNNRDFNLAPDVMVVFGRPRWERRSYKQWEEDGIAPQVVFEIVSNSNSIHEMFTKVAHYGASGVEECYIYDPDSGGLDAITFVDAKMMVVPVLYEWTSPRLGVRFVPQERADMEIYFADGSPFLSNKEMDSLLAFRTEERDQALERANAERGRAEKAEAETDRLRALLTSQTSSSKSVD
ncbi:MAG: Uma2 family endonuclease [Fibrella sp.]|nr:Uma2 family endonuclease [Armatimonadota bacterium]